LIAAANSAERGGIRGGSYLAVIDTTQKECLYHLEDRDLLGTMAWARSGRYVVTTKPLSGTEPMKLWSFHDGRLEIVNVMGASSYKTGCWLASFSPDDGYLAILLNLPRVLYVVAVPSLRVVHCFEMPDDTHWMDWEATERRIWLTSSDKSWLLVPQTGKRIELPFGGEDACCCNPVRSISACADPHRITIQDLLNASIVDQQGLADGERVRNMRWSGDGTNLYAVTNRGLLHLYTP
jgi:hypothetical protein